jgi:hypothetical protein
MNLLKVLQLPRWILTDVHPTFHDYESMTTLEQTSRLYGKMKELIDSYNLWVEEVNKAILEYKEEEDNQDECFENRIIQTMNDYIASVDEKLACQDREFEEVRGLIDDLNTNIKTEVESATRSIIETMKQSGEFNDIILSTLDEVNERLSVYENEITQKFNDLQASVQADLDALSGYATDIETLKTDNTKNKNDILTLQTNYYNLDGSVDNLVLDNQTNKDNIAQNTSDIENLQDDNTQNKSDINELKQSNNCSSEEIFIGYYIDKNGNKIPKYKRILYGTVPTVADAKSDVYLTDFQIDKLFGFNATIRARSSSMNLDLPVPYINMKDNVCAYVYYDYGTNKFIIENNVPFLPGLTCEITVIYTKRANATNE